MFDWQRRTAEHWLYFMKTEPVKEGVEVWSGTN